MSISERTKTLLKLFGFVAVLIVVFSGITATASAQVTFFTDRAVFDPISELPVEDFEDANVAADDFAFVSEPLNSSTFSSVFSPGDILAGIAFEVNGTSTSLAVYGPDFATNSQITPIGESIGLVPGSGPDSMDMIFSGGGVNSVGFDLAAGSVRVAELSLGPLPSRSLAPLACWEPQRLPRLLTRHYFLALSRVSTKLPWLISPSPRTTFSNSSIMLRLGGSRDKAQQGQRGPRGHRDPRATPAQRDPRDYRDPRATPAQRDHRDPRATPAQRDHRDPRATPAQRDHRDPRVKAQRGHRDPRATPAQRALRDRVPTRAHWNNSNVCES